MSTHARGFHHKFGEIGKIKLLNSMKIEVTFTIRNKINWRNSDVTIFILDMSFRGICPFTTLPPEGSRINIKMHREKFGLCVSPAIFDRQDSTGAFTASINLSDDVDTQLCSGSTATIDSIDELDMAIREERNYGIEVLRPEIEEQGFVLISAVEWTQKTGNVEIKF